MIKKLSDMRPGEVGTVAAVNGTGNVKHRLVDMGVVPGTAVRNYEVCAIGRPSGNQSKKLRAITTY